MARWELEIRRRIDARGVKRTAYYARKRRKVPGEAFQSERLRLNVNLKGEARKVIEALNRGETAASAGIDLPNAARGRTLAHAIKVYLEHSKTKHAPSWHRSVRQMFDNRISEFWGPDALIRDVTSAKVEQYRQMRLKQKAWQKSPQKGTGRGKRVASTTRTINPKTVNREVTVIKSLVGFAIDRGWLPEHARVHLKQLPEAHVPVKFCSVEEVRALLDAAREQGTEIYAYIALAYYAGLRNGSIVALQWDSFSLGESGRWTVTVRQKGNKLVTLPMRPELIEALELHGGAELTELRTRRRGYWVFPSRTGGHRLDVRTPFQQAAKAAGLDWVTPHVLRHSVATHLVDAGVPLQDVADFLGHRLGDLSVVRLHYEGKRPGRLDAAIDKL